MGDQVGNQRVAKRGELLGSNGTFAGRILGRALQSDDDAAIKHCVWQPADAGTRLGAVSLQRICSIVSGLIMLGTLPFMLVALALQIHCHRQYHNQYHQLMRRKQWRSKPNR